MIKEISAEKYLYVLMAVRLCQQSTEKLYSHRNIGNITIAKDITNGCKRKNQRSFVLWNRNDEIVLTEYKILNSGDSKVRQFLITNIDRKESHCQPKIFIDTDWVYN